MAEERSSLSSSLSLGSTYTHTVRSGINDFKKQTIKKATQRCLFLVPVTIQNISYSHPEQANMHTISGGTAKKRDSTQIINYELQCKKRKCIPMVSTYENSAE